MRNILIIIEGILAKHFLERLCLEKALETFTIISRDTFQINNEDIEFFNFDATSSARLEAILTKDFSQALIYMENEFDTKKTYETLRALRPNLQIEIMDFWGLSINDNNVNLLDAKNTLSRTFLNFLPNVALTAQYIGLGLGEIMEVKIPTGSIFAYRHISSIQQKRWRIVLIYRNSKIHFVKPSFVLEPNDSILIVGDPVVLKSIFNNISQNKGQFPIPFGNNILCLIDMKHMSFSTQEKMLNTSLLLLEKSNAKKLFVYVVNPKLNEIYFKLKQMSFEAQGIFFDFFNTDFKAIQNLISANDIGLILADSFVFEKEKVLFYKLKIPLMTIGLCEFDKVKESIMMSADTSEFENNANLIADLSKQLELDVVLYHYNPNLDNTKELNEYFASLSKLYDKNVSVINKKDENPLLNLSYRDDLLQFISFEEELLAGFKSKFSLNLNSHYYKMSQNYQLFIPVE